MPLRTPERGARLKAARQGAGFPTALAAAEACGWNRNTYASNENGNAPYSYKTARIYGAAFGVDPSWLYEGRGTPNADVAAFLPPRPAAAEDRDRAPELFAPVIGRVGADTEGRVLFATGQSPGDLVPIPPGGTASAVALHVVGQSMHGLVDHGGLIYFEDQRTPPSPDMLGHVVVVETDTDEVLVKRLLRGSKPGLFDLESLTGPPRKDCRLRWAAHITAIIPPHQARRILRSSVA